MSDSGHASGTASRATSERRFDVELHVDGPSLAVQALAGAPILRLYPISAPAPGGELAIGARRAGSWLRLGITCDARLARASSELDRALRAASDELFAAASRPRAFNSASGTGTRSP